jgi:hypothetical protein
MPSHRTDAMRSRSALGTAIAVAAAPGDTVLTGDPAELGALIDAAGVGRVSVRRLG